MRRALILAWISAGALACSLATSLDGLGPDASAEAGVGANGGACYPNGTCNPGLTCTNNQCRPASSDGGVDSASDGSAIGDAASDRQDGFPNLLCGSKQCEAGTLCCFGQSQAFCTTSCAGPFAAAACDDSRQCAARFDSGAYTCCVHSIDAGNGNAATLCGTSCLRTACNPVDPVCPNAGKCTGLETVAGYSIHYCQ